MYRSALRVGLSAQAKQTAHFARRFASTTPRRSGTFRGTLARWGIAGAVVYYYNTSTVFADEPKYALVALPETQSESETYSTVDAIAERRRAQAQLKDRTPLPEQKPATSGPSASPDAEPALVGGLDEAEEEAANQGAFNEETGEINWDCPCLGGMAHGVCGDQFRAAFSCFVYSKEEPKGVDCIEHFKAMQNCFREHPDIYGSELDDEEEPSSEPSNGQPVAAASQTTDASGPHSVGKTTPTEPSQSRDRTDAAKAQVPLNAGASVNGQEEELLPKAWHDTRASNTAK